MFSLSKSAVGLDISDYTIEVVELEKSGRGAKIVSKNRASLSPGVVLHGRIQDAERLKAIVFDLLKTAKPKPITNKKVIFGLPEVQVFTHAFRLRGLEAKDLERALPSAVANVIPLPEEDLTFSHVIVEKTKEYTDVTVSAASKTVVAEWSDFLRSLGFEIEALDIEPLAIFRDVYEGKPPGVVCAADIGVRTTNLSFFDAEGLRYTQVSHIAGGRFTEAIAPQYKNDLAKAEEAKVREGLGLKNTKAKDALEHEVTALFGEMQKAIAFFEKQREEKVAELVFAGGGSQMKGFLAFAKKNFSIPLRLGSSATAEGAGVEYLGAIGMALRGINSTWMNRDPAIPLEEPKKKKEREKKAKSEAQGKTLSAPPEPAETTEAPETAIVPDAGEGTGKKKKKQMTEAIVLASILLAGALIVALSLWYKSATGGRAEEARENAFQAVEEALSEVEQELPAEEVAAEPAPDAATSSLESSDETSAALESATSSPVLVRVVSNAVASVNLRAEPTSASALLLKVAVGTEHERIQKNEKGDWWKLKVVQDGGEVVGWMSAVYLVEVEAVDNVGT